jgi:hypothetical protein
LRVTDYALPDYRREPMPLVEVTLVEGRAVGDVTVAQLRSGTDG